MIVISGATLLLIIALIYLPLPLVIIGAILYFFFAPVMLILTAFIVFCVVFYNWDKFRNNPKTVAFLEHNYLWIYGPKNKLYYFLSVLGITTFALGVVPAIILTIIL